MGEVAPLVSQIPQVSEHQAVINMIERVARDPAADMDKLERLLDLKARHEEQKAKRAFAVAMSAAQSEMRRVAPDSANTQTKSKYASYAALDRVLRPIYTKHNFSLSFNTAPAANECLRVLCEVTHDDGFSRNYQIDMPADGKGAKGGDVMTRTHATGSAASYGMRYLLKMIFNVAIGEDDDDGVAASSSPKGPNGNGRISAEQLEQLQQRIVQVGFDIPRFCQAMGRIPNVAALPASKFKEAMTRLDNYGKLNKREAVSGAAQS